MVICCFLVDYLSFLTNAFICKNSLMLYPFPKLETVYVMYSILHLLQAIVRMYDYRYHILILHKLYSTLELHKYLISKYLNIEPKIRYLDTDISRTIDIQYVDNYRTCSIFDMFDIRY